MSRGGSGHGRATGLRLRGRVLLPAVCGAGPTLVQLLRNVSSVWVTRLCICFLHGEALGAPALSN